MEFLLFLLAVLVVVVTPVLALVAFLRTRRLRELERRLARLESSMRTHAAPAPARPAPIAAPPAVPRTATLTQPPPDLTPLAPVVAPRPTPEPELDEEPELEPLVTPRRPTRTPVKVDWERWIGVRGAAVVGGIAFAIAGILFFKHAFERGWITPEARVAVGGVVGLVAIALAELLRPRGYRFAPQALAAAGVVILYASTWAAHRLYALVSFAGAFPITAAITVACAWIAIRHQSLIVAVLGLVGGFLTPLVLETGEPSALRLFGYVLLLDLGLLAVAGRMRRPVLSILGVVGTFALELLWVQQHLASDGLAVMLVSMGLLALVFAISGARGPNKSTGESFAAQAAALLLPFLFVVHFALHADLGERLWPLALLAALLAAAACVVAGARRAPWLAQGAAVAAIALPIVWALTPPMARPLDGGPAWELALSLIGLALVVQLADAWTRRRTPEQPTTNLPSAPVLAAAGGLVGLCVVLVRPLEGPSAPWLVGLAGCAALLFAQGRWLGPWLLRPCAALGAALGLGILLRAHEGWDDPERVLSIGALWLVPAGLLVTIARFEPGQRDENARLGAWLAALAFPLAGLVSAANLPAQLGAATWPAMGSILALAAVGALAANALPNGLGFLTVAAAASVALNSWLTNARTSPDSMGGELLPVWLGIAGALMLAAWPLAFRRWYATKALAWRAAAFVPVTLFVALEGLGRHRLGDDVDLVLPLAFALGLGALLAGAVRWSTDEERERATRRVALTWFAAIGAGFAALVLPLTVGRYETPVALALVGLAWTAVWRRLDHAGLKYWALLTLGFSAFVAIASAPQSGRYPSSNTLVWSWTSWAVLLPTAALFAGAWLFRGREVERARPFERAWYKRGKPVVAAALSLLGALCLFAWINLAILDAFETGERIVVAWERAPARDLTQSIAWVVYALVLLAIGMARRSVGVRWLSLVFLLLALGKVFLHDLGELEGLYRVVSFMGLGLSLIVVSLAYQRFVFGREGEPPAPDAADTDAGGERA